MLATFWLSPDGGRAGDGRLHLRVLPAGGDAQLRAGLHDPQAGDLQRQVLLVGELDQAIERRNH